MGQNTTAVTLVKKITDTKCSTEHFHYIKPFLQLLLHVMSPTLPKWPLLVPMMRQPATPPTGATTRGCQQVWPSATRRKHEQTPSSFFSNQLDTFINLPLSIHIFILHLNKIFTTKTQGLKSHSACMIALDSVAIVVNIISLAPP